MKERIIKIILVFSLLVNLSFTLGSINNSFISWNSERKSQTALTVKYFIKDGWQLDYQTPIIGAPWKIPMEFPTYQTIVYWVHLIFSGQLEAEGRIVSLLFFYASLFVFYLLLTTKNIVDKNSMRIIIAFILLSNYYMYWAGVFLIETTALFFSLLFALMLIRIFARPVKEAGLSWLLLLLVAVVAILTKVTTFLSVAIPGYFTAVVFNYIVGHSRFTYFREHFKELFVKSLVLGAVIVISVGVEYSWVHYTDSIKAENPLAVVWTSDNTSDWVFGDLAQRLQPGNWITVFNNMGHYNPLLYIVVLLMMVYNSIKDRTAYIMNMLFLTYAFTGFLIFFNLYYWHAYYHISSSLFYLTIIAYNILLLADTLTLRQIPSKMKMLASYSMLLVLIAFFTYRLINVGLTDKYVTSRPENNPYTEISELIKKTTSEKDYLVVCRPETYATFPYYADRKVASISEERLKDPEWQKIVLSRCGKDGFKGIVSFLLNKDELPEDVAALWNVSPQPVYKKIMDSGPSGDYWMCYYR